jgi:hypothetical protein
VSKCQWLKKRVTFCRRLFSDAVNIETTQVSAVYSAGCYMNDEELKRIWKEAAVASSKIVTAFSRRD